MVMLLKEVPHFLHLDTGVMSPVLDIPTIIEVIDVMKMNGDAHSLPLRTSKEWYIATGKSALEWWPAIRESVDYLGMAPTRNICNT